MSGITGNQVVDDIFVGLGMVASVIGVAGGVITIGKFSLNKYKARLIDEAKTLREQNAEVSVINSDLEAQREALLDEIGALFEQSRVGINELEDLKAQLNEQRQRLEQQDNTDADSATTIEPEPASLDPDNPLDNPAFESDSENLSEISDPFASSSSSTGSFIEGA